MGELDSLCFSDDFGRCENSYLQARPVVLGWYSGAPKELYYNSLICLYLYILRAVEPPNVDSHTGQEDLLGEPICLFS